MNRKRRRSDKSKLARERLRSDTAEKHWESVGAIAVQFKGVGKATAATAV